MVDVLTPEQMIALVLEFIGQLDAAQERLEIALKNESECEFEYRHRRMEAWADVPDSIAKEKEDFVNSESAAARLLRDEATGRVKAAMEEVRNARQKVSAMQTVSNLHREVTAFERVGPEGLDEAAHYSWEQKRRKEYESGAVQQGTRFAQQVPVAGGLL